MLLYILLAEFCTSFPYYQKILKNHAISVNTCMRKQSVRVSSHSRPFEFDFCYFYSHIIWKPFFLTSDLEVQWLFRILEGFLNLTLTPANFSSFREKKQFGVCGTACIRHSYTKDSVKLKNFCVLCILVSWQTYWFATTVKLINN